MTATSRSDSLRGYLNELLEELDSLAQLPAEADLSDHPQLNLVEPAQKQVQIGRGSPEALSAKRVVEELVLGRGERRHSVGAGFEFIQRTAIKHDSCGLFISKCTIRHSTHL